MVLVWWSLEDIDGLCKEKDHMIALWQHVSPLINGRFGAESKSNET